MKQKKLILNLLLISRHSSLTGIAKLHFNTLLLEGTLTYLTVHVCVIFLHTFFLDVFTCIRLFTLWFSKVVSVLSLHSSR